MKWIALVFLLAAPEVSERDAQEALKQVGAMVGVDDKMVLQLLVQGCSEIKSCADGCAKPLSDWANGRGDDKLRACTAFKGEATAWLRDRLKSFYDRVAPKLTGVQRKQFDRARERLKL